MVLSVYVSPNVPRDMFDASLDEIEALWAGHVGPCMVMGDFNAKSPTWGSNRLYTRGAALMEAMGRMDMEAAISEGGPTFVRAISSR